MSDQKSKGPAHEIRVGRLVARIWRNQDEVRGGWYSVTLSRVYTDKFGKEHSAQSMGRDDLLPGSELLRLSWLWIADAAAVDRAACDDVDAVGNRDRLPAD